MCMVGHEAVRKNCKVEFGRCAQELTARDAYQVSADEMSAACKRAERKEIALAAGISESCKAGRAHAWAGAITCPAALKGRPTPQAPLKGRPTFLIWRP